MFTWQKVKWEFLGSLIYCVFSFLLLLAIAYSGTKKENTLRNTVRKDPVTTRAIITAIHNRKSYRYAEYFFQVDTRRFTGKTFYRYRGYIGDTICVTYNKINPWYSVYCAEDEMDDFSSDLLPEILKLFGITLLIFLVLAPLRVWYRSKRYNL